MGWRFQRRIKILPGVSVNLSRRGVSTSVGVRGARMTFGNGQRRTTVGIPGTGISHTEIESTNTGVDGGRLIGWVIVALLLLGWLLG